MPILIFLAVFGLGGQEFQDKYEHCKEMNFESEYCELQKTLHDSSEE